MALFRRRWKPTARPKPTPSLRSPKAMREHRPGTDARVRAIHRRGQSIKPAGDTVIEQGDEVFLIAARKDIRVVMGEKQRLESPVKRIVIAGGGNIGFRLAQQVERD